MSAPFTVTQSHGVSILRDDLFPGGTKRRGLEQLLRDIPQDDLVYAGTIFGHGALALAQACADHSKQAHLFLSCNDTHHPVLERLNEAGGNIHAAEPLPVGMMLEKAELWAKEKGAFVFPLAFDMPDFQTAMTAALKAFDVRPYTEIWCSSVSGTLAKCLKTAFPHTPLKTVSVVAGLGADYTAPEKYHQPAKSPPPYPACPYTDAKVWQFALEHASEDALIWNTAG